MAPSLKKPKMSPPENIIYTYGVDIVTSGDISGHPPDQYTMNDAVTAVQSILKYKFNDPSLLEEALTHSSYTTTQSYQRLEFVGDAVIQLAITNFVYLTYPDLDPGKLSDLRSVNISTEKLARVAVTHGLHKYVCHKAIALSEKVKEFVDAFGEEKEMVVHGGVMKAPKVLADIVESVAAAVYIDCGFNLPRLWMVIREILEPIVMLKDLEKQPQPITMLYELCQKDKKEVDIKHWRKGERTIASVYVDGEFIASGSSENKENAKLHAAEAAVSKITSSKAAEDTTGVQIFGDFDGSPEKIESAKQKVCELCNKKRWSKPIYKVEKVSGPAHDKKYTSSVQLETSDTTILAMGDEMSRLKEAENSAASKMYSALRELGHF